MSRYVRLLRYLLPYRRVFSISFVAAVVASVLDGLTFALLIPFLRILFGGSVIGGSDVTFIERLIGPLVQPFAVGRDSQSALIGIVVVILVTVALKNIALYVATYTSRAIEERVTRDLRNAAYAHLQLLGLEHLETTRTGHYVTNIVADTEHAKLMVSQGLQSVIRNGVLILVYLGILFSISWRLGLITLVLAPMIALAMRPILSRVRSRFERAMQARGDLGAIVTETVAGARLVKASAAERYEKERFEATTEEFVHQRLAAERFAILASPLSETLGAAVFVSLLLIGSLTALEGNGLRPELFVAFLAVTLRLLPPVKMLAQFPAIAEQALSGAARVFNILDTPVRDIDPANASVFTQLTGSIEFRDVWFAYHEGVWVLQGVNLDVPVGTLLAIVGHSGAGKSTLVDLLPRFIDPTRGDVMFDGVSTRDLSRASLRRSVAIVSQETIIFNDTVRANIAYGDCGDASLDKVQMAARAANAHDFIEALPRGYDTILGERGTKLSGGERQRIAIARAILRDAPILILDEATSALDSESEQLVQQAVARLMENRTVFVIAHRLSTVQRADVIAVVEGGQVVELGSHGELSRAGGRYQELYELAAIQREDMNPGSPTSDIA